MVSTLRAGGWQRRVVVPLSPHQQPNISVDLPAHRQFQVWATWFPKNAKPQTFIVDFPSEQLDLSAPAHTPFRCRVPENGIEEGRCWGNLRPDGHHIAWNLRIQSHFGVKLSDKGWIGFSRSPHSDAAFSGEISFDGQKISGEALGFGVQGHNCGYRHRTYWRWMHAYFPHAEGASTLEALVYDLPLGLVFRNAVWWHKGKMSRVSKLKELEVVRTRTELRWKFSGQLEDGSPIEALLEGARPRASTNCPTQKPTPPAPFPYQMPAWPGHSIKLGSGETLATETGAVLEMGGA